MASFLVFLPSARPVLIEALVRGLAGSGFPCQFEREGAPPYIEFAGTANVVYLQLDRDEVHRAELDPDYSARRRVDERIIDVLIDFDYELLDDDDPRIDDGAPRIP